MYKSATSVSCKSRAMASSPPVGRWSLSSSHAKPGRGSAPSLTNIPVASPAPSPVARCPTHLGGGTSQTQVQVQAQSTTSGAMDAPPSWPGVMADEIVHEIQLESMVGAPGYVGGLCQRCPKPGNVLQNHGHRAG